MRSARRDGLPCGGRVPERHARSLGRVVRDIAADQPGAQPRGPHVRRPQHRPGRKPLSRHHDLYRLLHPSGDPQVRGLHRPGRYREEGREMARRPVVVHLRHHRLRDPLKGHLWRFEAGQLGIRALGGTGAGQGRPHCVEHVLARQRSPRPIDHYPFGRRHRPPVHAELPGDGTELRRFHDHAARRAPGPVPARARRSGRHRRTSPTTGWWAPTARRTAAALRLGRGVRRRELPRQEGGRASASP